jgi:hypothetical protein
MKKPLARDDPPTWNDLPAAWRENSDQMKRVAKLALSPKKSIERKKPPVGNATGGRGQATTQGGTNGGCRIWATAANGGKPQSAG